MVELKVECIFCKIINHTLPATYHYEDELTIAIDDLHPQAPIHRLIIPKKHIATLNELTSADALLIGKMFLVAQHLAKESGIAQNGYRTIVNCNRFGGQIIYHLHIHLLGGKMFSNCSSH